MRDKSLLPNLGLPMPGLTDIHQAEFLEGQFVRHKVDMFSSKQLVAGGFRKLQFNFTCFVDAHAMVGLMVNGIPGRVFYAWDALITVGELVEFKTVFVQIEMNGLIEGIGAVGFFVEVTVVVVKQESLNWDAFG